MFYLCGGSPADALGGKDLRRCLFEALEMLGPRRRVVVVPPDFTRFHSRAGELTRHAWEYYGNAVTDILPALGTHAPMTAREIGAMFGDLPLDLFRTHDWRGGVAELGKVPADFVRAVSAGAVHYAWPAQAAKLLAERRHDLILSIGQVVPHEVIGMASYNKNIFVGTGGAEGINKSHFLGAAYGMERIMGRADTPVRRVLDYATDNFTRDWPIVYVHTVLSRDEQGGMAVRGLFIGDSRECFERAAELSLRVNFEMVDEPLDKVVTYLDPDEFKSAWLGNKSIYRTRMAIADGGELIVLAPGVRTFGEDAAIDGLIRKYGYTGTPRIMDAVERNSDLSNNLSAAAHLIHGSSEGRFRITYCPGHMGRDEIEGANFAYGDLAGMLARYNPEKLKDGYNTLPDGETLFYISNPALGLWAHGARFTD